MEHHSWHRLRRDRARCKRGDAGAVLVGDGHVLGRDAGPGRFAARVIQPQTRLGEPVGCAAVGGAAGETDQQRRFQVRFVVV